MNDGLDLDALAPVWVQALQREGLTSPARVALWVDDHGPPASDHVVMVVRRVRGEVGVTALAAEGNVPHSRVQAILRRTTMELIVPRLRDIAAWARARANGFSDDAIADLSQVQPEVVALALDGWPSRDRPLSDDRVVQAYGQWMSGAPLGEVATILGRSPGRLQRELANGTSSLPQRLQTADLVARFGWHPSTVTRHRRGGKLPFPDGQDGARYWWWSSTIEEWAAGVEFHLCSGCHRPFLSRRGLRGHVTREH